jgi:hypothetical protein
MGMGTALYEVQYNIIHAPEVPRAITFLIDISNTQYCTAPTFLDISMFSNPDLGPGPCVSHLHSRWALRTSTTQDLGLNRDNAS